ncbi:hypothetical protein [Gracilimonas sp.]|uniref:hypothetical protein n=1 Tax=Gracilimonas sp. TaxID=1974203 RepID=UPI0032EEDE94
MLERNQYISLLRQLKEDEQKAISRLLLRQEAEYEGRGIRPGDDTSLDNKFISQIEALEDSFDERRSSLKDHRNQDKLNEFYQEFIQEPDPYGLGQTTDGTDRPIEPDAESDYFKGFTQGYKLQELAPDINEAFINSGNPNDERIQGMQDGREQHNKDKELESDISPEIWDELNTNKGEIETGHSREKEPDKGKDIN